MSRYLHAEPATDAALFDMLHALLGVGDYDDSADVPWFKFRMVEIQKIKVLRRRRGVSLGEFALAARYCYRRRIPVRRSWEVCGYIPAAKKQARASRVSDLAASIATAVENERSRADCDERWVGRLLRAQGPARAEVLAAWERERA